MSDNPELEGEPGRGHGRRPNPRPGLKPPFPPGQNSQQEGLVHRRGPDRRPRRLVRNMLIFALSARGRVNVEVEGKNGKPVKKRLWVDKAALHGLVGHVQQIATGQNSALALRLMEFIAQEVDGRPASPSRGAPVRATSGARAEIRSRTRGRA